MLWAITFGLYIVLLFDNFRLRLKLRRLSSPGKKSVAINELKNGLMLPDIHDERWTSDTCVYLKDIFGHGGLLIRTEKRKVPCYRLGKVIICLETQEVFVDGGMALDDAKEYARAVIMARKQQVVLDSIEGKSA